MTFTHTVPTDLHANETSAYHEADRIGIAFVKEMDM
jgi:hypothetical protein